MLNILSDKHAKCIITKQVCPKRGMNAEAPADNLKEDYCPAWLVLDHRVDELTRLQTGREVERKEGCSFGLLPFMVSGSISAANQAREETIALRHEENTRSNFLGSALEVIFQLVSRQEGSGSQSSLPSQGALESGTEGKQL